MKKTRILGAVMAVVICLTTFFTLPTQAAATFIEGSATKADAKEFELGKDYVTSVTGHETNQWYKFTTLSDDAYYFLESQNIDVMTHSYNNFLFAEVCTEFNQVLYKNGHTQMTSAEVKDYKLEPNTTYYLRIRDDWHSGDGNFRFRITPQVDPDKNESTEATVIELNKDYKRTIESVSDFDWFTFNTTNSTKYEFYGKNIDIKTHPYSTYSMFRLTLLDTSMNELKRFCLGFGEEESDIVNLEPKTKYYIRIENHDDNINYYNKESRYTFSIGKPEIKADNVAVASSSYVYNGKARKPKVTVTYGDEALVSGKDYTVTYSNNINAGKASVTVNGKGSYIGSVTKTFTIAKAAQTIKVKAGSYTKAMGNKSFSVAATGKGKITYITGNRKIVTVSAKGLVKLVGAGKTKITVKAAGDKNYKAATKTINITVKPKVPAKMAQPKTARLSKTKVKISWKKVSGATGYQISRAKSKTGTSIVATCKSSATNKTLTSKKGTTYYYKVRAYKKVNGQTSYGAWSKVKYQK